jgi:hypothetical protein
VSAPARGLPRRIWAGSYEFPLTLVPRDHARFTEEGGEADGITHFDPPDRGIFVADDLPARGLLETVLHEITHAVNYAADIEDGALEEDVADGHGRVWTQLWLDNPRLQAWFTRTLNQLRRDMKEG